MNIRLIERILGKLLIAYAGSMCVPLLMAVFLRETSFIPLLISILITSVTGIILLTVGKTQGRVGVREGFAIVAGAWALTSLFGALPYWFSGSVLSYIDGVFETVSGLTTSGASVIDNVEILPKSILLWRSITHWLGGMGIIVLFIVFLPSVGSGAVHLFNAEVPGPLADKVLPRIRDTAIQLWKIYAIFTFIQVVLLVIFGMSVFDAVNHSFATLATGGFSTKNSSIKYYDSIAIELTIVFFMILAGGNFGIYLQAWHKKTLKPFKNTELIWFLTIIACSTVIIAASLWLDQGVGVGKSLRESLFQVASIITTTGFMSADFDQWPSLAKIVLFILMFVGGSAGSTAGGIKVSRLIILFKLWWAELRRATHPRIVTSIKSDGKVVDPVVLNTVSRFFFIYISIFTLATILVAATGLEPFDAMSAVAATLGNVGPGFGVVGPTTTFSSVSIFGEVVLILCMLLGRLELFTLLVLLQPEFWRKKKGW